MNKYMQIAIEEAKVGIINGHGGPFGAVIVKDEKIVSSSHNRVVISKDPTYHGEIGVIRDACQKLGTYDLTGCILFTTGEPCPMCLCACMWANISKIYYGCTIKDNEDIGFRDNLFYDFFGKRKSDSDYLINIDRKECLELFEHYKKIDKKKY